MKKYTVELNYVSNENLEIPARLEEFEVDAKDMQSALKNATLRLSSIMLDKDDYEIVDSSFNEDEIEISFSDSETGQDVSYIIIEME
ncbi:hypothetical protein ACDN41_12540 [Priestia aryabhattai]|uniref:hypothetical protein n=1 Tax=Priestia aryabhattai TaxID=412384 RepID=UPI0035326334